jgi:hypothetical protein
MSSLVTYDQLSRMKHSFEQLFQEQPLFQQFFVKILRLTQQSKIRFGFIFYVIRDKPLPDKFKPEKNKHEIMHGLIDLCVQLRQAFPQQMKELVRIVDQNLEYGYNNMARLILGDSIESLLNEVRK